MYINNSQLRQLVVVPTTDHFVSLDDTCDFTLWEFSPSGGLRRDADDHQHFKQLTSTTFENIHSPTNLDARKLTDSLYIVGFSSDTRAHYFTVTCTSDIWQFNTLHDFIRLQSPIKVLSFSQNGLAVMLASDEREVTFVSYDEDLTNHNVKERSPHQDSLFEHGTLLQHAVEDDSEALLVTNRKQLVHFPSCQTLTSPPTLLSDEPSISICCSSPSKFYVCADDAVLAVDVRSRKMKEFLTPGVIGVVDCHDHDEVVVVAFGRRSLWFFNHDGKMSEELSPNYCCKACWFVGQNLVIMTDQYSFHMLSSFPKFEDEEITETTTEQHEESPIIQTDLMEQADRIDAAMDDIGSFPASSSLYPPLHLEYVNQILVNRAHRNIDQIFIPQASQWSAHLGERPNASFNTQDGCLVEVMHCSNHGLSRLIKDYKTNSVVISTEHYKSSQTRKINSFEADLVDLSPVGVVAVYSNFHKRIKDENFVPNSPNIVHFSPFPSHVLELKQWNIEFPQEEAVLAVCVVNNGILVVLREELMMFDLAGLPVNSTSISGSFLTVSSSDDVIMIVGLESVSRFGGKYIISLYDPNLTLITQSFYYLSPGISIRWVGFTLNRPSIMDSLGFLKIFEQFSGRWVINFSFKSCLAELGFDASETISTEQLLKLVSKYFIVGTSESFINLLPLSEGTCCPKSAKGGLLSLPFKSTIYSSLSQHNDLFSSCLLSPYNITLHTTEIIKKRVGKSIAKRDKEIIKIIATELTNMEPGDRAISLITGLFKYITSEKGFNFTKDLLIKHDCSHLIPELLDKFSKKDVKKVDIQKNRLKEENEDHSFQDLKEVDENLKSPDQNLVNSPQKFAFPDTPLSERKRKSSDSEMFAQKKVNVESPLPTSPLGRKPSGIKSNFDKLRKNLPKVAPKPL
ncbi:hypothetical protein P9112_007300 [Eukaryota sp. TZLM1-RC]